MFGYLVELEVNFSTIGIGQALDNPLDIYWPEFPACLYCFQSCLIVSESEDCNSRLSSPDGNINGLLAQLHITLMLSPCLGMLEPECP